MPDPIRAGDPPTPLPSEVLGSVDGGRGIAAFVLRPADLDRLPLLTTYPPDPDGDAHAHCRAIQAGEREQHAKAVLRLRSALQAADAHSRNLADAAEEQADALRAEVARLTGLLDDTSSRRSDRRPALIHEGEGILIPETFLPTPEHPAALRVYGPGLVEYDGHELRITYDTPVDGTLSTGVIVTPPMVAPDPVGRDLSGSVDADPRRPHLDSWPDDAVLLRYRELRALVALHLDRYCDEGSARAMREGDVPLRLAEVLDR